MMDFEEDYIPDWVNEESKPQINVDKFLSLLNEEQKKAVIHEGSPLLILAGAGSGKTRVITTKIAYLIATGKVKPSQILAVTFTKKAAAEMKERAIAMESLCEFSQIRTFHSFGSWFLRVYAKEAGLDPNFTIYDDDDCKTLLKKACPNLNKDQLKIFPHKISLCKDYFLTPEDSNISDIENDPDFKNAYQTYEKHLRETGNVDFGDLIMLPALVLQKNETIRKILHNRFRVIMVDEYQDTNVAQFRLLETLSGINEGSGTYVCVVGDDDQSIYKFRGAEVKNILNFENIFPNTKIIRLEKNYRSTEQILSLANDVVSHNENRLGKKLVSQKGEGHTPKIIFFGSQDEEAKFCSDIIEKAHEKGVPYSDWAILYRTNAQSLTFESQFMHSKIPYTIIGTVKFYEREEIKDLICLLSLAANPKNEIAFRRIINKPSRSIGEKTQDKIIDYARAHTEADGLIKNIFESCEDILTELPKKASEGIKSFLESFNEAKKVLSEEKSSFTISDLVINFSEKMGLSEYYKTEDQISNTSKVENMQELANSGVLYPCTTEGLIDFLDHIELDRTIETPDAEQNNDSVTLITFHNTKGLEYPRVIMTGMENGLFPRNPDDFNELEEERRLCYVGITRAKKQIYFTSCTMRRMYGRISPMSPSNFLREMNLETLKILGQVPYNFGKSNNSGIKGYGKNGLSNPDFQSNYAKYKPGTAVYHDEYGSGFITSSSLSDDGDTIITVKFQTGIFKKFFPKYNKDLIIEQN